jgi:hypothetical protein
VEIGLCWPLSYTWSMQMSWKEVTTEICTTVSTSLSGCWRIGLSEFPLTSLLSNDTECLRLESYDNAALYNVFVYVLLQLHSWLVLPWKRGSLTSMWEPAKRNPISPETPAKNQLFISLTFIDLHVQPLYLASHWSVLPCPFQDNQRYK